MNGLALKLHSLRLCLEISAGKVELFILGIYYSIDMDILIMNKMGNSGAIDLEIADYISQGERINYMFFDYDWGIAVLDRNYGDNRGALGWSQMQGEVVDIAGFPADKGGLQMWADTNIVINITPFQIYYQVDTMPGVSGAAVEDVTKSGVFQAIQ